MANRTPKGDWRSVMTLLQKPTFVKSLNRSELSAHVSRLTSVANKRIKRFKAKNIENPLIIKSFSVAKKTKSQLMEELKRVMDFLKNPNTTLQGYSKFKKTIQKMLIGPSDLIDDDRMISVFFDIYDKILSTGLWWKKYRYWVWEEINNFLLDLKNRTSENEISQIITWDANKQKFVLADEEFTWRWVDLIKENILNRVLDNPELALKENKAEDVLSVFPKD